MQDEKNQAPVESPNRPPSHGDNSVLMGVLSYLGPLVIISYVTAKDNPFVKFHIKQGLVLLSIGVILWIASSIFWSLMMIVGILQLGVLVLAIVGIINAVNKKETVLPIVGKFSKYFNI